MEWSLVQKKIKIKKNKSCGYLRLWWEMTHCCGLPSSKKNKREKINWFEVKVKTILIYYFCCFTKIKSTKHVEFNDEGDAKTICIYNTILILEKCIYVYIILWF